MMKKNKITRLIMLNQAAGPLFRELGEDLAKHYEDGCILMTGHLDTLKKKSPRESKLRIEKGPTYDRRSMISRLVSWLLYIFSSTRYVLKAKSSDAILIVSNPPILSIWVWILTRIKKCPYAVIVYDIHPEVLIKLKILKRKSILSKIWNFTNKLSYRDASSVFTLGKRMACFIESNYSLPDNSVKIIPPWVDINTIKPINREKNLIAKRYNIESEKIVVLYSGNMGKSHDIESMLEAARVLERSTEIVFVFIGEGEKFNFIKAYLKKYKLTNTLLLPFQPESMIRYSLPLADISLVSLDQGMENLMVPSKSFYYLASGSALIAIANEESELSDLLNQSCCGKLISPGNSELLAKTISEWVKNPKKLELMKKNSRFLAEKRYAREKCTYKFVQNLKEVKLL